MEEIFYLSRPPRKILRPAGRTAGRGATTPGAGARSGPRPPDTVPLAVADPLAGTPAAVAEHGFVRSGVVRQLDAGYQGDELHGLLGREEGRRHRQGHGLAAVQR